MKGTAEVVDLEEARRTRPGDSNGGDDHFITMKEGTIFCSSVNGNGSSFIDEYMLLQKNGLTVMLQNAHNGRFERHLGQKFWKQNTLVQILHVPEERKENGNGA